VKTRILPLLLVGSLTIAAEAFAGTGRIVIVNSDSSGSGLNDPTPATPVGGNPGTTLGQQRLNVFQAAADRWSAVLDTNVDILVSSSFRVLECTDTGAVLGAAGPWSWRRDFTNAPKANVWYPIALANKFSGTDLAPNDPDITMYFNTALGGSGCPSVKPWYYGLDHQTGGNADLYVVVLHELGHGLGIAGAARAPGFSSGRPAIFDVLTRDLTTGQTWDKMSDGQRNQSLVNTGNVVWDGPNVSKFAGQYLQPVTVLAITDPLPKNLDIGTADFGAAASGSAISGRLVRVIDPADEAGASANDGCSALTNADLVRGNIAFVDRGNCTFLTKARNAVQAGATGVVIGDRNESYSESNPKTCLPPGMTGSGAPASDITVPVISIGISDAEALRAQFVASTEVSAAVRMDSSQLAGMRSGYVRLYAPCTDEPGSSAHHFDVTASPNLLMEPNITATLQHDLDLTAFMLMDIGWTRNKPSGRGRLTR
jgi:hypothetical protein